MMRTQQRPKGTGGLHIDRFYTKAGVDPYAQVQWTTRKSVIKEPDGTVVFKVDNCEVPAQWSQLATDIIVSKYFRKAGVPQPDGSVGGESSAGQVVHRIASSIRWWGEEHGYFADAEAAEAFEAELRHMMITQRGAFNSPVWFNCGHHHVYGVVGSGGNWAFNDETGQVEAIKNNYARPQCSACFIQRVEDNLVERKGIFELLASEARLFKYGSGTGTNFSRLRSKYEKLSGGGTSSGLMSFLKVLDAGAGATKSGGTTRRAAKMVSLDMDHPEIEDFINWKAREERKVAALIAAGYDSDFNGDAYGTVSGQNSNNSVRITDEFMAAVHADAKWDTTSRMEPGVVVKTYKARDLWEQIAQAAWACADPGTQYDTTVNKWHTCKATDRIYGSNPCVTGDTLVATPAGWRRIDSLLDAPADVVGSDGEDHPIAPAFRTGTRPIFRLRTQSGYSVKLTADHKVLTANRGDVPACELNADDVLLLGRPGFGTEALDHRLGEYLGLVLGDGCIATAPSGQRNSVVTLAPEEEKVAKRVHAGLLAARQELAHDGRAGRQTLVSLSPGTVRFGTGEVPAVLERYAVVDAGSAQKGLRDAAYGLDRASLAAVLRGLFTAGGTVADDGDASQYVSLDSTSLELLRQVQRILLGFGIKAKLCEFRRAVGSALLPDPKGGTKSYPTAPLHSLRLSRSSRVAFAKEIGFLEGSPKGARLAEVNRRVGAYEDAMTDPFLALEPLGTEPVFDLTEPSTHHFVADGLAVHNCSEYMFLDDTACNLASLNLMKFLKADGSFDLEAYRHAIRIFFVAQEILVGYSSYPTKTIAKNSEEYRPLGLGYANLGTLLMVTGHAYDSADGRAIAGALTAVLTGHAYRVSAEMAAAKGGFVGLAVRDEKGRSNQETMESVIAMHLEAARRLRTTGSPLPVLEGVDLKLHGIRDLSRPEIEATQDRTLTIYGALFDAAVEDWEAALELGRKFGWRNAQATVLAPTGTIGLLMDCDTTGVEPDFSLVKFKKLAGGGYFKIINQSVPAALKFLGYSETEAKAIERYAIGAGTLEGAPVSKETFLKRGFTEEEYQEAYDAVAQAKTFNEYTPKVNPKRMREKGFSRQAVAELVAYVEGHQSVEGSLVKPEHLSIFDCANKCGDGTRFIHHTGHLRMMAAVQPFLSGAISKTINMPNEVTVADVRDAYEMGWKLGLKAVALYRDGCKLSQPLSSGKKEVKEEPVLALKHGEMEKPPHDNDQGFKRTVTIYTPRGAEKVDIQVWEFADGRPCEVFVGARKSGTLVDNFLKEIGKNYSRLLQLGMSLDELTQKLSNENGPLGGQTDHRYIKSCLGIQDLIGKMLRYEYFGETDFLSVKPDPTAPDYVLTRKEYLQTLALAKNRPKNEAKLMDFVSEPVAASDPNEFLAGLGGDAPDCDQCGHTTVRNGACYKCLNCGNSMGCS
ncbi:MAG: LAGLIDADG family homing endonuclease [Thermoplasmatota archaeon]